ncbi:MAG: divergent polysaccharide deacetylase family protein [Gammaproteobacteria bacterium]
MRYILQILAACTGVVLSCGVFSDPLTIKPSVIAAPMPAADIAPLNDDALSSRGNGFPRVAIIIDDIGYQSRLGEAAVELPGPYAVAVMPFAPHSRRLASLADKAQKNVIVHLPMEALSRNHLLGEGAIFSSMAEHEIHAALKAALASLPQAIGVNNHMGSLLTSERKKMDTLMTAIAEHENLFFVDSKTTSRSAARFAAAAKGVTAVERHVFLDNDPIRSHIKEQLVRLVEEAKERGHALAIGHPYPATLATLKAWKPAHLGVELVSLRDYVETVKAYRIKTKPKI